MEELLEALELHSLYAVLCVSFTTAFHPQSSRERLLELSLVCSVCREGDATSHADDCGAILWAGSNAGAAGVESRTRNLKNFKLCPFVEWS